MVHLPHAEKLRRREVKTEATETAEAEAPPCYKKFRLEHHHQQQWCTGASATNQQLLQHDLLDEPSPLGLRLKKSPSLLDLIQMKLAQTGKMKETQSGGNPSASEKLKASNFPASVLRIGTWERISRYEGDLVAKCYFAKHKLVWEVLDGGLKSKIEIQWSDICALKVNCPENEPGTLDVALSRHPRFFKETNPQPRKHTLWQETSDFTGGHASLHRRHFLQCPTGMMNKHIEKLVHCDPRLYSLSQQNDISLENPYFEPRCSIFEDPEDSKCREFDHNDDDRQLGSESFQELLSPHSMSGRSNNEATPHSGIPDGIPRFPSSVLGTREIKEGASGMHEPHRNVFNWTGFRVPGIRRSMSRSKVVNQLQHHIYKQISLGNSPGDGVDGSSKKHTLDELTQYLLDEHHIDKQISSGNLLGDGGDGASKEHTLDELTRYLLNDSQIMDRADEKMLMSRVKSLCCLLQRDSAVAHPVSHSGCDDNEMYERKPQPNVASVGGDSDNPSVSVSSSREAIGELLMHLPRISSFPHFL